MNSRAARLAPAAPHLRTRNTADSTMQTAENNFENYLLAPYALLAAFQLSLICIQKKGKNYSFFSHTCEENYFTYLTFWFHLIFHRCNIYKAEESEKKTFFIEKAWGSHIFSITLQPLLIFFAKTVWIEKRNALKNLRAFENAAGMMLFCSFKKIVRIAYLLKCIAAEF